MAIYDTMNFIKCDVSTVCIGMAASMAAFLLSSGAKGKRFCLPNSEVMIHQPLGGAQGQASDIVITANHIQKIKRFLSRGDFQSARFSYSRPDVYGVSVGGLSVRDDLSKCCSFRRAAGDGRCWHVGRRHVHTPCRGQLNRHRTEREAACHGGIRHDYRQGCPAVL